MDKPYKAQKADYVRELSDEDLIAELLPDLKKLESKWSKSRTDLKQRRAECYKKAKIASVLLLALCFIKIDIVLILPVAIPIIWLAAFLYASHSRWNYTQSYNELVIPKVGSLFGEFDYRPHDRICMSKLRPSLLIPPYQHYHAKDLIEGKYHGLKVSFQYMKLISAYDDISEDEENELLEFRGLAILLELPKDKFQGHIAVVNKRGQIQKSLSNRFDDLQAASIPDKEFSDMFEVFTNDQFEARYLLHPAMIEKLKYLAELYDTKDVALSCYKDRLLVLLRTEDRFFIMKEKGISYKPTDPESILHYRDCFQNILGILDYLEIKKLS